MCLLCFNTIQKEGNQQCPACRTVYDDEYFKTQAPPERKKSEVDGETGWEPGKKKAVKKAAAVLAFPGFHPKVEALLLQCYEMGAVTKVNPNPNPPFSGILTSTFLDTKA